MPKRITALTLSLAALASLAGTAHATSSPDAKAAAKRKAPAITMVSPMRVRVGSLITIRGRNFSRNPRRNTVVFVGPGGRSAFAKPIRAGSRRLVVRVPGTAERLLNTRDGARVPTRMRLRVLAGRFSRFTPPRLSPVVLSRFDNSGLGDTGGRSGAPGAPGGGGGGGSTGCGSGSDPDNDLLSTTLESQISTNPCLKDTDLDGIEDGFEYKSAVDLNNDEYQEPNQSLPYPGKRPYPNALDPSDANVDYDGDTLTLAVEQSLWKFSSGGSPSLFPLTYSDGLQHSVYQQGAGDRRTPALPAAGYPKQQSFVDWAQANGYRFDIYTFGSTQHDLFDFNLDGSESASEGLHYDRDGDTWLSDEERDEDADGLTNYDEDRGRLQASWWAACYRDEKPYYVTYADTELIDADSDGDTVLDGADDQDHDDLPNVMEMSRIAAYNDVNGDYPAEDGDDRENGRECKLDEALADMLAGVDPPIYHHENAYGRVNPFNPCLPVTSSRTCNNYPSFDGGWAPYDESPNWFALN
jgi:IPT/TIG domain